MTGASVSLRGVGKRYGTDTVLADVDLDVPAGSFTVLLGPSGCGKSTLLRIIAGLDQDHDGQVLIAGQDASQRAPVDRGVAMVFQSYALFPHLSVQENIIFGLRARRVPRIERDRRLAKAAALVGIDRLLDRRPNQLSGGQQQRVALARAIVAEAPVCLMDEPLSNLDAQLRSEMRREIRMLQRQLGLTMIYVTHDQTEAMSMADQVVILCKGRIEQVGRPPDLHARPETAFVAGFLGNPPMRLLPLERAPGGWHLGGAPVATPLPGNALLAGVRPHQLHADPAGPLAATVESAEFLGLETLVTARLQPNGAPLQALLPGHHLLEPGTTIRFAMPKDIVFFDRASGKRLPDTSPSPPAYPIDLSPKGMHHDQSQNADA